MKYSQLKIKVYSFYFLIMMTLNPYFTIILLGNLALHSYALRFLNPVLTKRLKSFNVGNQDLGSPEKITSVSLKGRLSAFVLDCIPAIVDEHYTDLKKKTELGSTTPEDLKLLKWRKQSENYSGAYFAKLLRDNAERDRMLKACEKGKL